MAAGPEVQGFYHPRSGSIQYLVSDPATRHCVIIDPVLDFDEKSGATATRCADAILAEIARRGFSLQRILDTHPHADHFSAAGYLKDITGAPTATGAHVVEVQRLWAGLYDLADFPIDGRQWDHLFADGEEFALGALTGRILFSPGHTLSSITYLIGDAAFIHDTLFMPDSGTARADFPGGDARRLWRSIERILTLPEATRLFTGHDYGHGGRDPAWESTVVRQKARNAHIHGQDEESFVRLRTARDRALPMPRLILPALQVNIAGGRLPPPGADGRRYLKIPLDAFGRDVPWE